MSKKGGGDIVIVVSAALRGCWQIFPGGTAQEHQLVQEAQGEVKAGGGKQVKRGRSSDERHGR